MTFHSIVRQWCKTYKPMLDNPDKGNKRFYLTDSQGGLVEMAKGIMPKFSPMVMMESVVEGGGTITRPERTYPVYFFVRARKMADGEAAAEAREEAWYHCQQFLAWLLDKHNKELAERRDGDFARINLDNAMIDFVSTDPKEDGWYGVMVQFTREEPLNLCVSEEMYVECEQSE